MQHSKQNKVHIQEVLFITPLILMTMVAMIVDLVKKWSILKGFANLKENSGLRLPKASKSLESDNVGLKFHFTMPEFVNSMNQELKCGKK